MHEYRVKLEIFGKVIQMKVKATSEDSAIKKAKEAVLSKIETRSIDLLKFDPSLFGGGTNQMNGVFKSFKDIFKK